MITTLSQESLQAKIAAEIAAHGSMSFARFMQLALYAPSDGYYRNGLQKFGCDGDFVTAPELSSLFSHCLANQCREILTQCDGGDILEFGAGSGVMAADILLALKNKNQLPHHYFILELSASLKALQKETIKRKIPDCLHRVIWLNALPEKNFKGVVLANEVLDAMPVTRFRYHSGGVQESSIIIKDGQLAECFVESKNIELNTHILKIKNEGIHFENNYTSEVNGQIDGWIKSIGDFLEKGVVLLIDYGFTRREYYHPDRSMGTLMCHHQHRAHHNPFIHIGLQDITAHVDFTSVAEASFAHNFEIEGFVTQAAFLLNCDLLSFLDQNVDEKTRVAQNQQVMQLTSPNEMGELFKVIGLSKGRDFSLMGFSSMNYIEKL